MTQNSFLDRRNANDLKLVSIIGLGGAGRNIVDDLNLQDSESMSIHRFDSKITASEILPVFGRLTVITLGLGGRYGSETLVELVNNHQTDDGLVFVLATFPYDFEGEIKRKRALDAIDAIKGKCCTVTIFENDRIKGMYGNDNIMFMNRPICESIQGLIGLLINPGIISLDYNDLKLFSQQTATARMAFVPLTTDVNADLIEKHLSLCRGEDNQTGKIKKTIMGFNLDANTGFKSFIKLIQETISPIAKDTDTIWSVSKTSDSDHPSLFICQESHLNS